MSVITILILYPHIDKEYENSCLKVIEKQLAVLIYLARINFVGLPRSGKSCTLRRLIGKFLNLMKANLDSELPSTGVAERNQAFIRKINKCFGFISNSQWSTTDLEGETGVLNQFFHQLAKGATAVQVKVEPPPHEAVEIQETDKALQSHQKIEASSLQGMKEASAPQQNHEEKMPILSSVPDIKDVFSSFQEAMEKEDWDTIKYLLEDTMYLINTDTGGQTEFLDLMSRFIMGPALNLIVSRLTDSLDQVYKIYSTNEEGVSTEEEDSVVTLEDIIFQALASISCMKTSYEQDKTDLEKDNNVIIPDCSSKAIFVGTFKDQVSEEEFEEKDKMLRKKIEQTEFYSKKIVLYASDKHLILPLDNLSGGQEEVDLMRKTFETAITKNFKRVRIPATWLMLSNNLRHTGKRTMTLVECQAIASKIGISAGMLPQVLWFLHYRVGILLYYPEVEGFEEIIILDIQVVFDVATQLIKKTFIFDNVNRFAVDNFKEKAKFVMSDLQMASENNSELLISLEKMVTLLQHHRIVAPLPPEDDSMESTFFMPCVLKSATRAELDEVNSSADIAPLMIRYECGYMPLGIFSSLIIELVSQEDDEWELVEQDLYRNKIEFLVGDDGDTVTLISRPTFMEINVLREADPMKSNFEVCSSIRSTIEAKLTKIHLYMKYSSSTKFQYGFECLTHPGKEHLCVVKKINSNRLFCLQNLKKPCGLPWKNTNQKVWFHKIDQETPEKQHPEISSGACAVETIQKGSEIGEMVDYLFPCAAKWKQIGIALRIHPGILTNIEVKPTNLAGAPCSYLIDVLTYWANNSQGSMREALIKALRSPMVNEGRMALKLEQASIK